MVILTTLQSTKTPAVVIRGTSVSSGRNKSMMMIMMIVSLGTSSVWNAAPSARTNCNKMCEEWKGHYKIDVTRKSHETQKTLQVILTSLWARPKRERKQRARGCSGKHPKTRYINLYKQHFRYKTGRTKRGWCCDDAVQYRLPYELWLWFFTECASENARSRSSVVCPRRKQNCHMRSFLDKQENWLERIFCCRTGYK